MQQPNVPHASGTLSVRTSCVAHLQPDSHAKIDSTSQDHSNITNSFANLARAGAPDVSEPIPVITSPAAPLQPELSAQNRQHL
eukprot:3748093-Pyramimonas_sp.AAC.1